MDQRSSPQSMLDLQRTLTAHLDKRLTNIGRLALELEARLSDLRQLLDRNRRNEQSRKVVRDASPGQNQFQLQGIITIDDVQYAVTEDFKNAVYAVADEVDLDELDAAKLCIDVQTELDVADDSLPYRAIIEYHTRRQTILDCVRITLREASEADKNEDDINIGEVFEMAAREILQPKAGQPNAFWSKCIDGLRECEDLTKKTRDQLQAMIMTGQALQSNHGEALQLQRMLLAQQHECLTGILCYIVRTKHINVQDFRSLLNKAAQADMPMDIISHYAAPIVACATLFGAGTTTLEDSQALDLHRFITGGPTQQDWKCDELKAAASLWWLVEYSSRHSDQSPALQDAAHEEDAAARRELFFDCLKRKAFRFMVAIADHFKPEVWHDPTRADLIGFLLEGAIKFPTDSVNRSEWFAQLTMEEFQNFTEALISHMPDVLRELRTDENNKRRNMTVSPQTTYDLELERFLLIVAYAYQDDTTAAIEFWSDSESNLYGFLRWMSRRLATPTVAAFCELMRALANESNTADHAHRFLLEDAATIGMRTRKAYCVSWALIFEELDMYATTVTNRPALSSTTQPVQGTMTDPDQQEYETNIMLEAYLRLTAHVIHNSQQAREWVLREQPYKLHETMLKLAQSSTTPKVQAGCFAVLDALTTDKPADVSDGLWTALDNWISGGGLNEGQRSQPSTHPPAKRYFQRIGADIEVATAFVNLLNALVEPQPSSAELSLDALPFPEQLGSSQRRNGIDVYIDFVLGNAFLSTLDPDTTQDRRQISVLQHACLRFAQTCLSTFNEHLIMLHRNAQDGGDAGAPLRPFNTYARLHPFARTMEYMFNDRVAALLLDVAQQNFDELQTLPDGSPLVQACLKAVEVVELVLRLQSAYFDVVRPAIKLHGSVRGSAIANPAVSSFDEILSMFLPFTAYLVTYITSDHYALGLSSIALLRQMSRSRKLSGSSSRRDQQRLISQLDERSDAVQVVLRQSFEFSEQQFEEGAKSSMFNKARAILELLQDILDASPDRPNIAHCLLGLQCHQSSVEIESGSLFASGRSLFHAIVAAAVELPFSLNNNFQSWLTPVRSGCVRLTATLATSAVTRDIVLGELRSSDFLQALRLSTHLVSTNSLWDDNSIQYDRFCHEPGAHAFLSFLQGRESSLDVALRELQNISSAGVASAKARLVSVLADRQSEGLGTNLVTLPQLIDFYDLEFATPCSIEALRYFADITADRFTNAEARIDLKLLNQVLILKKQQLWATGKIKDQTEELAVNDEMSGIMSCYEADNVCADILAARLRAVESWTDLVSSFVSFTKDADFAHSALQALIPRLDYSLKNEIPAAEQFAKLALVLVRVIGLEATNTGPGAIRSSRDSLLQVFRACIRATVDSTTTLALRDICYRMGCSIITVFTTGDKTTSESYRRQLIQQLHDMSDRVVRVLAEDAFSDRGVTRVSALLFLDSVLGLFSGTKTSSSILRALSRVNFVPVLIDTSIGNVASTFRHANTELTNSLAYFHTAAALLLRLAQSPDGPQLILRSDFIAAVEDSGLFSTDPDIGLDIDNPAALQAFYRLLSAIVRILVAIVVGRGSGDGAVIQTARRFLTDNRTSVASIFKLASKRTTSQVGDNTDVLDVANELSRLMFVTDFIEADESVSRGPANGYGFS